VPGLEEFRARIRRVKEKYPYLVAEQDGVMAGYAYVEAFKGRAAYDWAVETSIYVPMDGRRRGVGRRLYQALEDCMVRQGDFKPQRLHRLSPGRGCVPDPGQRALPRKAGLPHGGGISTNVDTNSGGGTTWFWMEKIIGEHRDNQPAVRWWPEIAGED